MSLTFNAVLEDYGIDPCDVRLLRHRTGAHGARTPYALWRDNPDEFLTYQSIQTRFRVTVQLIR